MKIIRSFRGVRCALGVASTAALVVVLCGFAPLERSLLPRPVGALKGSHFDVPDDEALRQSWALARADAQKKCHEKRPGSHGGFYAGADSENGKWELICLTQGAARVAVTRRELEAAGVDPRELTSLGWAEAGRAALKVAAPNTGFFTGEQDPSAGLSWLLLLGEDVQRRDVAQEELPSGFNADWRAASRAAAQLCKTRVGAQFSGFFTGAAGRAAGSQELACLPIGP